jgi:predicted kinase
MGSALILFVAATFRRNIAAMQAVILVGIQGSGKSTFYEHRFSTTHLRISRDITGTAAREGRLVELCLRQKRDFVIDNTNATASTRAAYVQPALAAGFELVCYYFPPDVPNALRRNEARSGKARIPKVGIYTTAKRLQEPTFQEGFHRIFWVALHPGTSAGEEHFVVTEKRG